MKSFDTQTLAPRRQDLWDQKGSHMLAGALAPQLCVDGNLRPTEGAPALLGGEIHALVPSPLPPAQLTIVEEHENVDFVFPSQDRARLRASAFTQRAQTAPALGIILSNFPSFTELGLRTAAEW